MSEKNWKAFSERPEEEQELLYALHRWYDRAFQPMSAFFQSEFRAIVYMLEHGSVNPSELSKPLGVTRQRVTTLLSTLRGKGYVEMEMDEADRRRMRVRLTDAGVRYFMEQSKGLSNSLNYMFERLGDDGVRQLIGILNRLIPEEEGK